jgi:hypothetical protein
VTAARVARRTLPAATLAALLGAVAASSPAQATRQEQYTYVAVPGDVGALNCDGSLKVTDVGYGGLCFDIWRTDVSVAVTINDESGVPTGGNLRFRDASGTKIGTDLPFCGKTASLAIPTGAKDIIVWSWGAKSVANISCSPSTRGTMTAVYESA